MTISLKRKLALGSALLLVSTMLLSVSSVVGGASPVGTPIHDCYDLQDINNNLSGDYYLANDIDCSETWTWSQGFAPIGGHLSHFEGRFDGQGYKITNLYMNRPDVDDDVGLFGVVGDSAKVKNMGLVGANIRGSSQVGGIAGVNLGSISCCYVESSSVMGTEDDVGGVVGENYGKIYNCYFVGTVDGRNAVGGLAGRNSGQISLCHAWATVTGHETNGALVGFNTDYVSLSWSDGSVDCDYGDAGGLVGESWSGSALVENCYSLAKVSGNPSSPYSDIGGLVGALSGGAWGIENCYSTGNVSNGDNEGGLVGHNYGGAINDCFWDTDTSGQATSDGGTGLSTADMKRQTTFESAGWDFVTIWQIDEDVSYPYLKVQGICTIGWSTIIDGDWIDTPPVIDGYFADGEWTDYQLLIEAPIHTQVYFRNDASFLYVCVDAANDGVNLSIGDYSEDDGDYCDLVFDTGNDEAWTQGHEDYFHITGDGGKSHMVATSTPYQWTDHCDFSAHAGLQGVAGFGTSPNAAANHRIYEFQIPLTLLGASPGDTIGLSSWPDSIPYDAATNRHNIWPPGAELEDLGTWGDLVLASPPASPPPVGGEAYPVNKVGLMAPWLALAVVIVGGLYLVRRRVGT